MTRNEQREFQQAIMLKDANPELAARIACNLHRAGSSKTQSDIECFLSTHPMVRSFVRGTPSAYFVI